MWLLILNVTLVKYFQTSKQRSDKGKIVGVKYIKYLKMGERKG